MGTQLLQLLVLRQLGIASDVLLVNETEWSDDGERHLAHLQTGRHCIEASLKREVHQSRADNVVAMMAQGNLVASQLLGEVEELLAAIPGAEEAGGLSFK